jgi:hypothetical protein
VSDALVELRACFNYIALSGRKLFFVGIFPGRCPGLSYIGPLGRKKSDVSSLRLDAASRVDPDPDVKSGQWGRLGTGRIDRMAATGRTG